MTEKNYSHEEWLVNLIVEAITDKGSHPHYHNTILRKQRRLHPKLWRYLDALVQVELSKRTPKQGDKQ